VEALPVGGTVLEVFDQAEDRKDGR
jgi:hypothetical protein